MMQPIKTQAEFDFWLAQSAYRIEKLFAFLPQEVAQSLDYSPESLIVLGQAVTSVYPSLDDFKADTNSALDQWAGTYAGEVFIRLLGGKWSITLDDETYAYLGIPGIYGHTAPVWSEPEYPTTWITTAIARHDAWFIYDIVEAFRSGNPIRKR
jgi:hypothetical protein